MDIQITLLYIQKEIKPQKGKLVMQILVLNSPLNLNKCKKKWNIKILIFNKICIIYQQIIIVFYSLKYVLTDSNNIVVIKTDKYQKDIVKYH